MFDSNGKSYIVATDYYSNYPEIISLLVTSGKAVIIFLKTNCARHGLSKGAIFRRGQMDFSQNHQRLDEKKHMMEMRTFTKV